MSRNWKEYNNKLVKRVGFNSSMDFIQYWNEELEEMNKNKSSLYMPGLLYYVLEEDQSHEI